MAPPLITEQMTFLRTQDLAGTGRFYEDVQELPLALDRGDCRTYRCTGDGDLRFCQQDGDVVEPSGIILTLVTAGVDGWHRHLSEKDVRFDRPPVLSPTYNVYHCFLRDPNGCFIEIQSFEDPAWLETT